MQGFLSNLGSDLYLFEILQNAVDDGALNVRFQVTSKFQKRTIGFMCIGLKVVYKRFSPATGSFGLVLQPQWKVCKRPARCACCCSSKLLRRARCELCSVCQKCWVWAAHLE